MEGAFMEHFQSLSQAVAEVIRQGRIGTPVSLRIVDHTTADHGRIEPILARTIEAACTWVRGAPEQVSAAGGIPAGQITALIRFASGQSALVSVGVCGLSPP